MSRVPAAPPVVSADTSNEQRSAQRPLTIGAGAPEPRGPLAPVFSFVYKALALTTTEIQKLRHDPWDIFTRSIQPVLWLVLFGGVFGRLRVLPENSGYQSYLDFITPGILAQSVLSIAIFVGIQLIFERDLGPLQKYLVAPVPREAIVVGKGLGAGVKGVIQAFSISILALIMGVHLTFNPLAWIGVIVFVLLGASFFSSFSLIIAALVGSRERVQGLGQIVMMPLFFASNALYPLDTMPAYVSMLSFLNPLSYMVDGLRTLMIENGPSHFGVGIDLLVLIVVDVVFVMIAGRLFSRVVQ